MFDSRDALLVVLLNAVSFLLHGPCCAPSLPYTVGTKRGKLFSPRQLDKSEEYLQTDFTNLLI